MSKRSVFVESVDGSHYQNPVLHGTDWYLGFGDSEMPVVHVRCFKHTSLNSAYQRARKVLRAAGARAKVSEVDGRGSLEIFPPKWDRMLNSFSFQVRLLGPIPTPQLFESRVNGPSSDCVDYTWNMEFAAADIAAAWTPNARISNRLLTFVLGPDAIMIEGQHRRAIALIDGITKLLGDQIKPWLSGDVRDLGQLLGERVRLSKP